MSVNYLLQEDGFKFLLEDGSGFILLENQDGGFISVPIPDNNYSYERTKRVFEARRREIQALEVKKLELDALEREKEQKIKEVEAKRQSDLSDLFLQNKLITLIKEANRLRLEQAYIRNRIAMLVHDEEEAFILLVTIPFMS